MPSRVYTSVQLDDLIARFTACALPREEWTHAAHLAVGLWHVEKYGAEEALVRLRRDIRLLNDSHGTLNTATSGYHETTTHAYVVLLAQFSATCSSEGPLAERVTQLLTGPLADKKVLLTFWSRETLLSERARRDWVEPDLAPLGLSLIFDLDRL